MKKRVFIAVLLLNLLAPGVLDAEYVDVFIGTLEIREGRLYLVRCDLIQNTYLLLNKKGAKDCSLKELADFGVVDGRKMQAWVRGEPEMDGDRATLKVHSIDNVRPGSCHLTDMLEDAPAK